MSRFKTVIIGVLLVCLLVSTAVGTASMVHFVRRGAANAAALRDSNATLSQVAAELPLLSAEVNRIGNEKNIHRRDVKRLRRQIQSLNEQVTPVRVRMVPVPVPGPTRTLTHTVKPHPKPQKHHSTKPCTVAVKGKCLAADGKGKING